MNASSLLPESVLLALRPGDISLYLASRGWVSKPYGAAAQALQFRNPSVRGVDLLLPLSRDLGDYTQRMADVVIALATIEQRPIWVILNDLSGPSGDVFRLKIAGSVTSQGSFPLDDAIKLFQGGRQLLWSSAFSLLRPEALHPHRRIKQVEDFVKTCRLGQTERGSFVATIFAPVPPEIQPPLANLDAGEFQLEEQPFSRRVTTRVMSTLGLMASAISVGKPEQLLDAVAQGVSANICDALVMMKPPGDESRLDVDVSWSKNRPHLPTGVPRSVSFPQEAFTVIEEVGRQLCTRLTAKTERFRGKVLSVKRALRPLIPEVAGWMVIATDVNGSSARVKADLGSEDFVVACEALRDDLFVEVRGVIRHDVMAREYVLTEPSDLRVLRD
jgi:hypothetical protein